MLNDTTAIATVAVKDLQAARSFYERTLGLTLVHTEGEEALTYRAGTSQLLVYRSQHAGTNKATAATWMVGEGVERLVHALEARGVAFQSYDMPGMTVQGHVYSAGGMKVAWFEDPDGNVHALVGA